MLLLSDIPKGVNSARVELWRDGKRASERTGTLTSLRGRGYRTLFLHFPLGELRALMAAGPVSIVATDEDGEKVAEVMLPPALAEEPGALAASAAGEFAGLAADFATRCPIYVEPEIIIT